MTMTANEVLELTELSQGSAKKAHILAIYRAADEGGVLQADSMLRLFRYGDPRLHTTSMLRQALLSAGCEDMHPAPVRLVGTQS